MTSVRIYRSSLAHEYLDCSQSPIFLCDRRCRCGSVKASETGESTKCLWVGVVEGTAGRPAGLSPQAINPTTPTKGHFVLSPVSLASRDQDDGPVELNDRHLRSHGKIGDCEQSNEYYRYFNFLRLFTFNLIYENKEFRSKSELKRQAHICKFTAPWKIIRKQNTRRFRTQALSLTSRF